MKAESQKQSPIRGLVVKLLEKSGLARASSIQDLHSSTPERHCYDGRKERQTAWLEMEYHKAKALIESQKRRLTC